MSKTLRDHVAEAVRAERVHMMAKVGKLDQRIAKLQPQDYAFADRILKIRAFQNPALYQMALYALIKRLGGTVKFERVEYEAQHGSFAWRFDKDGALEMRAVDDAKAAN